MKSIPLPTKLVIALICLVLLSACTLPQSTSIPSTRVPDIIFPQPLPTATPSLQPPTLPPSPTTGGSLPTLTPLPSSSLPSTTYTLTVQFTDNDHYLWIAESIRYVNHTDVALPDLLLVVRPERWPGSFVLGSLTWDNGAFVQGHTMDGYLLHIPLAQPLAPGGSLGLSLTYELFLPEIPPPEQAPRPLPYGYTARQTNLVDWYPYLPPYRAGEGWLAHEPGYFGEYLVYDIANYHVEINIAEPLAGLVMAASVPAVQEGSVFTFNLHDARNFVWSVSTQYQVATTTVGEVTIFSYFFPYHTSGGQEVLQNTADAVALYSNLFGSYPHTSLSIVEADFLDGMEYDGLYFLSNGFYDLYDGTPRGYLTAIAAHETAHQWWFGLVGNDQALEPWLDEALCTYMERLFYENIYPEYPAGSGENLADWWWEFRVEYYQPAGWVNGTVYDFDGFRPYRDAIYLHGAQFLEELRFQVGDDVFFAFLRDYATRFSYRQATAQDFFAVLSEHTTADLGNLINTYFHP